MEEKKWSKEKEELFNRWTKYHTKENRGIVGFQQSMEDVLDFILEELDKAREEGRKELLDSIIEGVTQLKDLVSMFNPMSPEIRAKQSGEIEAYNGLLEKLSKLTTK